MIIEHFAEARAWLSTWSGKLAAMAAGIAAALAGEVGPALAFGDILPEGIVRALYTVGILVIVYILPMKAAQKDAANGE